MQVIRNFFSELRLYICNHVVSRIPSHHIRLAFYRHAMGYKLADGVAIHLGARFDCSERLTMGLNSVLNENCRVDTRGSVTIGDHVSISAETIILTAEHDFSSPDFIGKTRPVVIEDYVFIGTRVIVLPGTTLHRGSIVAAGATVSRDIPPLEIVGGVPAKSIGSRNPDFSYTVKYRRLLH